MQKTAQWYLAACSQVILSTCTKPLRRDALKKIDSLKTSSVIEPSYKIHVCERAKLFDRCLELELLIFYYPQNFAMLAT